MTHDFDHCLGTCCPLNTKCKRHLAHLEVIKQGYKGFIYYLEESYKAGNCINFIPINYENT